MNCKRKISLFSSSLYLKTRATSLSQFSFTVCFWLVKVSTVKEMHVDHVVHPAGESGEALRIFKWHVCCTIDSLLFGQQLRNFSRCMSEWKNLEHMRRRRRNKDSDLVLDRRRTQTIADKDQRQLLLKFLHFVSNLLMMTITSNDWIRTLNPPTESKRNCAEIIGAADWKCQAIFKVLLFNLSIGLILCFPENCPVCLPSVLEPMQILSQKVCETFCSWTAEKNWLCNCCKS